MWGGLQGRKSFHFIKITIEQEGVSDMVLIGMKRATPIVPPHTPAPTLRSRLKAYGRSAWVPHPDTIRPRRLQTPLPAMIPRRLDLLPPN